MSIAESLKAARRSLRSIGEPGGSHAPLGEGAGAQLGSFDPKVSGSNEAGACTGGAPTACACSGPSQNTETKIAVNAATAAEMLSASRDHFDRWIKPQVKTIYSGRKRLYAVEELKRWARDNGR